MADLDARPSPKGISTTSSKQDSGPRIRSDRPRDRRAFQIKSPNGVMCHLKAAQRKGLIHREPNMARAIQLLEDPVNAHHMGLKLIGRIAAGQPIEAVKRRADVQRLDGAIRQIRAVSGDSMIDEHAADMATS